MRFLAHLVAAGVLVAAPAFALPVITSVTVTKYGTGKGTVSTQTGSQSCAPAQAQCTFGYVGLFMAEITATPDDASVLVDWTGCNSTSGNVCYVSVGGDGIGVNKQVTVSFMLGPDFPDFNADGKPDLVWRHRESGATQLWRMNGPSLLSDAYIGTVDPAWKMVGIGDFDNNGYSDLVWRNASGDTYVWYMNGATYVSGAFLFSLPPEWVIEAIADFNKDGKPDFLIRNTASGQAFVWFFDGSTPVGSRFLFSFDPSWRVEGVGDFNADGQPDLLFRNATTGVAFVAFTQFTGGALVFGGSSTPLFAIDPAWEVAQVADWNGDGSPDLVFRNRDSGVVIVWYMAGTTLAGSAYVTQVDPAWEIVPRR